MAARRTIHTPGDPANAGEEPGISPGDPSRRVLIPTKLNRPDLPAGLLVRPRLMGRLAAGLEQRCSLISAPAGYGKTTAVLQFLKQVGRDVAWVSLGAEDSDPDRFVWYVAAAVRAARPGSLSRTTDLLSAITAPPWSYSREVVVSELAALEGGLLLALDDYQVISSREVHELVSRVLEDLAGRVHLLILTRLDPPLPWARWRARGWVHELRAADLRLDAEEVRAYFDGGANIALSGQQIDELGRKTEGWIAGLQLARISLARSSDPDETVRRFSGSDRLIADYLAEEVIAAQPPEVRDLLGATAALERFCAPLCERLLPEDPRRQSAGDLLAHLEHQNLFLVPLDPEHHWFRYHHLFRQLLAHHLPEATSANRHAEVLQRAAGWFAEQYLVQEALQLWIGAGDLDAAADQLGRWLPAILDEDLSTRLLQRLLALFPAGAERCRLPLLVAHAYTAAVLFDLPRLGRLLEEADACLSVASGAGERETEAFRADVHALQAFHHAWCGNLDATITCADRALQGLPPDARGKAWLVAALYRAVGLHLTGRREESVASLRLALQVQDARGGKTSGGVLNALGHLHLMANDLTSAHVVVQQAAAYIESKQTADYFLGETCYLLGAVALERDQLDQAEEHFQRLADLRYLCIAGAYHDGLLGLAMVAERRGDLEGVRRWSHMARLWAVEVGSEQCLRASESFERRLAIRSGSYAVIEPAPAPMADAVSPWLEVPSVTHAEILVTHPKPAVRRRSLHYIDSAIDAMRSVHNVRQGLRLSVLRSVALVQEGRRKAGLEGLAKAVASAELQGSIRPLLGGGKRTFELLQDLASRQGNGRFLDHVFQAHTSGGVAPASRMANRGAVGAHTLTRRERDVLELVAEGYANKEIAARLGLEPEAVKKRLSRIYAKLEVHGRSQAVRMAAARGMLGPQAG